MSRINAGPFGFERPYQTASGLIVPGESLDDLVKARSQQAPDANKSRFFSEWATLQNSAVWGAREKPAGTATFSMLQEAARRSVIDAILIQNRIDQMKMVWQPAASDKDLGFVVVHDRHKDPEFKVTDEIRKRCVEATKFLQDPTPLKFLSYYPHNVRPHQGIKDAVSRLTRAELVIDRKVIQRYPRVDGEGFAAWHWLPGETIKPVDEAIREWASKNEPQKRVTPQTIHKMSEDLQLDIQSSAYVQVIDGRVVATFQENDISVWVSNPSDELNRWGYGVSRLEVSMELTTQLLLALGYNRELFKTNYPEQFLAVSGDVDKAGLEAFKQQILAEGGLGANWRLPVISNVGTDPESIKVQSVKLRDAPKDMLFGELLRLLIVLKAAAYGAHPSTINMSTDSGGSQSLFGRSPEQEMEAAKDHGLRPSLSDFCEWFTEALIKPRDPDLRVMISGLEPEDEKLVVDLRSQRAARWITKNEARQEEGLEPIGDVKDERNPWNMPADAPMATYLNTFSMIEQAEAIPSDGLPEDEDAAQNADISPQNSSGTKEPQFGKSLRTSRRLEEAREIKFIHFDADW